MLVSSFCASRPRDATRRMSATELALRSSVAAATPSQQQLRRSCTSHYILALNWTVAAPRRGTRRHLEEGRELRAASAPSQQHQLRRSSRSRRRQCPATMSGRRGFYWAAPRIFGRTGCTGRDKLSVSRINLSKELRSLRGWPNQF